MLCPRGRGGQLSPKRPDHTVPENPPQCLGGAKWLFLLQSNRTVPFWFWRTLESSMTLRVWPTGHTASESSWWTWGSVCSSLKLLPG